MSKPALIQKLEKKQLKTDIPEFSVGDTIKVHTRIIEGEKERIQIFTGTVIARKGCGLSETFSLHRVAYGQGMERVFLLHSPRIAKIELSKRGKVRRAKLYNLRGTFGKAAKVKGSVAVVTSKKDKTTAVPPAAPEIPEPVKEAVKEEEKPDIAVANKEQAAGAGTEETKTEV